MLWVIDIAVREADEQFRHFTLLANPIQDRLETCSTAATRAAGLDSLQIGRVLDLVHIIYVRITPQDSQPLWLHVFEDTMQFSHVAC